MAGQSNQFTPITFSAVLPLKNGIFTANMPPPPDTAWLQSIWGSVSKQANFVIKNIFLYPHFCQHKLWTYLLGNSLNSGRFHTKIGMNFWKSSNFKRPLRIFNFSHIIPFFVLSAFQRAAELHSFISMNQLVLVNLSNIRFSGPHFVPIWSPFLLLKIPISLKIR